MPQGVRVLAEARTTRVCLHSGVNHLVRVKGRIAAAPLRPLGMATTNSCGKGGVGRGEAGRPFVALGRVSVWLAVCRARRLISSSKSSVLRPLLQEARGGRVCVLVCLLL